MAFLVPIELLLSPRLQSTREVYATGVRVVPTIDHHAKYKAWQLEIKKGLACCSGRLWAK